MEDYVRWTGYAIVAIAFFIPWILGAAQIVAWTIEGATH